MSTCLPEMERFVIDTGFCGLTFSTHSIPMIFVAEAGDTPFLLDKWWEPTRPRLIVHSLPTAFKYPPLFSHAGLIVYGIRSYAERKYIVHSPMDCKILRITCSEMLWRFEMYGVFFHPLLKDYCSLWKMSTSDTPWDKQPKEIQYKILRFGDNPFFKTIENPFINRVETDSRYPLFIHKYLYWMVDCEQKQDKQFDVISEEFTVKPCPIPIDTKCFSNQTYLLNIDGALSFLLIFPSNITVWRLEDHAGQVWTPANYIFSTDICSSLEELPTPVAVVDGMLALLSDRRLLVCNLMHGTTKFFRRKKYNKSVLFLAHQLSLASHQLRNCKSDIYVDKDGKVDLKRKFLICEGIVS